MASRRALVLERPLLNVKDAAAYLGLSPRQLRRWHESGTLPIPVIKVAGRNYFDPDDLDRLAAGFERIYPNVADRPSVPRDDSGRFLAKSSETTRRRAL